MARLVRLFVAIVLIAGSAAACGGGGGAVIDAPTARSAVEAAAGVKLQDDLITPSLKTQGVTAYLTNNATIAADRQIVQVFVLVNGDSVSGVRDQLGAGSATRTTAGSRIVVHKNLVVLYAAFPKATDHGAAVESAVNGL
jgi:hypothetical protein